MNQPGASREDQEHARRDIAFHRDTATAYDASITREHGIYHSYSLDPFLDRLAADGGLAVDLGCGTGVVARALAARGWRVIAVDHSPEMLAIAARNAERAGLGERIEFRRIDLLDSDLPAGDAELVTCQGVLHHLADPDAGVSAMARILKPGGSFYISEPCAEVTPVGRAIAAAARLAVAAVRFIRRRPRPAAPETVEAPISAARLFRILDELGFAYEAEFVTHLPLAHLVLPDGMRLRLSLALSRPWRRRKGDIVFVEGRAPA
jgi:SAM-dependent methyltransferase